MENNNARLYQPNLTCAFDIMMTDDNRAWSLYMKNHEDMGITDEQFVQQLWQYGNVFTKRLIELKQFNIDKFKKGFPSFSSIISHNFKYTMYSVSFFIEDEEEVITKTLFSIAIGEVCKQMAKQYDFKLQGLEM